MSIRKTAACFFAAIWMLFLGIAAADQTPLIQDDAELLTAEEESRLYQDMEPLCAYGTPMFWTSNEPGNERTLAEGFYQRHLGNGQSGILFVINMKERFLTIVSAGEIYRTVTRSEADTITDNVYKDASRGEYFRCAFRALSQIGSVMKGERIAQPMRLITSILLGLLVGIFINFILVRKSRVLVDEDSSVTVGDPSEFESSDAEITVYKRVSNESSGGGSGGGGGGGGGSFGGGGHSF